MKAVVIKASARALCLVDRPEPPALAPHEVRVKVLDVGVCGTDREVAKFRHGTPPRGADQLVLGHEALGRVLEVGAQVTDLVPGQLVVPTVRRPCAHAACRPCRAGRPDLCASGEFLERGIHLADGFLVEHVVDDAQYLHPVAEELRQVGVLVEPLSRAERAISQYWQVQSRLPWLRPGAAGELNAVVLGAGPVGLLGAMVLRSRGFRTTLVSRGETPDPRSDFAESIGASFFSITQHPPAELLAALGPIDLVYEATGASLLAFKVLEHVAPNGVFILTGVPGRKAPVEIDAELIMRNLVTKNQLVIASVVAAREDYASAVSDLALWRAPGRERWRDALQSLISGRMPVECYRELLLGDQKDMKEVLSFELRSGDRP